MSEEKQKKLKGQIEEAEDRLIDLKKSETEAAYLIQDIAHLHQRQQEILNEIFYYSKGTQAQHSATLALEDLEEEHYSVMRHFEEGQEELSSLKTSAQRNQEQLQEDLLVLQQKEKEENHAEN